jgi:hypothetical protein
MYLCRENTNEAAVHGRGADWGKGFHKVMLRIHRPLNTARSRSEAYQAYFMNYHYVSRPSLGCLISSEIGLAKTRDQLSSTSQADTETSRFVPITRPRFSLTVDCRCNLRGSRISHKRYLARTYRKSFRLISPVPTLRTCGKWRSDCASTYESPSSSHAVRIRRADGGRTSIEAAVDGLRIPGTYVKVFTVRNEN